MCRGQDSELVDVRSSALHEWLLYVLGDLYGREFWLGARPAPDRSVRRHSRTRTGRRPVRSVRPPAVP